MGRRHRHTLETFSPISALVHESDDGGVTWTPLTSASIEAQGIRDVVRNGPVTYLLDPGAALMLQLEGDGWEILPMPALADYPTFHYPLARPLIDPNDPDVAYGMPGEDWELGLVRSTDGMKTWHKMDATIVGSSPTIVVGDPVDPAVAFISDDGGHTWRDSSIGLGNDGMFSITQHPDDRSVFFAGTYYGIVASTDGGATWQPIMNGLADRNEYYTLLIHPADHDVLFLSSSNGVFASLDAGDSWWPINDGLPTTRNEVRDNVADNLTLTADDETLLLGLVTRGVWRLDVSSLAP